MHCPLLDRLRPVTIADRKLINGYLSKYPPVISELTFTNIFCWAEVKHHMFSEQDGHLLITFREKDGCLSIMPPVGPHPEKIMHRTPEGLKKIRWARVPENLEKKVDLGRKLVLDLANSDYVYRREDLVEMKGKSYDGKRNFVKRFAELNPTVRPLTSADVSDCIRIQEQWLETQQHNLSARDESTALIKALENYDTLPLHGIGVFRENALVGFAIGEPLNKTTFVEHFEKALPENKGVYQFLLNAFVKSIPSTYTHINREQDLGIDGIRVSKESWQPEYMIRKYTYTLHCPQ
jgi:hypothetical protein